MDKFNITEFQGTDKLPYLKFDEDEGLLEIRGKSICTDILDFFKPLIDKITEYVKEPRDIKLIIALEYFNTRTSKLLYNLLKIMESVTEKGFTFIVDWHYDDEEIFEAGKDYESIIRKAKFNFINEIDDEDS